MNKLEPFPISSYITRLDLFACGSLEKTINIIKEEEDFDKGLMFQTLE